jgi:hypothetical protein
MNIPLRVWCVLLLCLVAASAAPAQQRRQARPFVPKHTAAEQDPSRTFFEMFYEEYSDTANLRLLHENKVQLKPLGTESIEDFDWRTHRRKDQSFWMRMENFMYLLPLIESDKERDKQFVRRWVLKWLNVHEGNPRPNSGCTDAMTVGIRALAFAWYVKRLESGTPRYGMLIDRLIGSIKWHQEYLADPKHFNTTSNHGMWESMGLFETTRVVRDEKIRKLALQRVLKMAKISASKQGLHREHSTHYHYHFMHWLSNYVEYLEAMESLHFPEVAELVSARDRMRGATYFMYDHRRNLPQIGDTDKRRLDEVPRWAKQKHGDMVLFDDEAGYAIYKDPPSSRRKRYIIFNIQNEKHRPTMRFHFHNDRLAVYYSDDGEVILSDQGRYSYTNSSVRTFYRSAAAHNLITHHAMLSSAGMHLLKEAWFDVDKKSFIFAAQDRQNVYKRQVRIPRKKSRFVVEDSIFARGHYALLWNIGPDVRSVGVGKRTEHDGWRMYNWKLVTQRGRKFSINVKIKGESTTSSNEVQTLKGNGNPYLGWYSPGYNISVPSPLIMFSLRPTGPLVVVTEIKKGH